MANYPKKLKDPTEAALSAIQEALNLQGEEQAGSRPEGDSSGSAANAAAAPVESDLFDEPIGAPAAAAAANDDQQSIGQVLRVLQNRPARSSYFVAAVFSCAWIVGCVALSWAYLSDIHTALGSDRSPAALMIGLGAAALLPIIFFFGVAHMAWRSQELRLIAQSMARVAMRLAEPESVARDSIVTVGQAIRREVAAMGDGVERALARAAELETLVNNEVAALERAYNDNEVRIRNLLDGLAQQRETLVGQAEQVRNAITNVHLDLSHDITTVSELIAERVNEAAQRITRSLAEKGEQITVALGTAGDTMIEQLGERGTDLLERLERTSDDTTRAIDTASDRLTTSLNFKSDSLNEQFLSIATNLQQSLAARLDDVVDGFSHKSASVLETVEVR